MKQELRDMLGKAAYEARHMTDNHSIWQPWDRLAELIREEYRDEAEAVILKFAEVQGCVSKGGDEPTKDEVCQADVIQTQKE